MTRSDPSRPELLVLHAVRLGGFSVESGIADRAELAHGALMDTLRTCEGRGHIEQFTFADSRGWILSEAGKQRDAELLREEREEPGVRSVLEATAANFETLNPQLVRVATAWQLRDPSNDADGAAEVLGELTDLALELHELMAELVERLPRFGRYPRQFASALAMARAGDLSWIAGVGRLSCHTVWAELHQDLLSTLGRDRSGDPHEGAQ